jgi:hypothetical protein
LWVKVGVAGDVTWRSCCQRLKARATSRPASVLNEGLPSASTIGYWIPAAAPE